MEVKELQFGHRRVCLYQLVEGPAPLVYSIDYHENGQLLLEACRQVGCSGFNLVTISGLHWNQELSPWPVDTVVSKDDNFSGGAPQWLPLLTDEVVPQVERLLDASPTWRMLAGYSLAGLFALWAGYQTDFFEGIAAASPSIWFPGFVDYMRGNEMRPRAVYLSLGDREERTRNPVMSQVGNAIRQGCDVLQAAGVECVLEWNNPATLGSLPFGEKLLAAFFQSMTLRTAGFAGLDQSLLTPAGKAVSIFLMLIGGSSGSTAGGLKTVTFVVLLMFLWNRMRGRYTVSVFHRTISDDHVLNAITIFILMITLSFIGATVICATSEVDFGDSLFETVSALATVGLSAGVTPRLSLPARIMIIIFMYFGRVGVLTLSVGFLKKKPAGEKYTYAHTDLLIG